MSAENEHKVTDFLNSWFDADMGESVQYLSEDVSYHNMPWEPVSGHAGVRQFLDPVVQGENNALVKMDITHTTSSGNTVMNERIETWEIGDVRVVLPVVGMFAFNSDGKISRWNDYFDAKTVEPFMAAVSKRQSSLSE